MTPRPFLLTAGFLIPAALILPSPASIAADVSWSNPGTGAYTNGANWSTANVPGSGDNAIISNGGTSQLSSGESASVIQARVISGALTASSATLTTGITSNTWQSTGDLQVGAAGQTGSLTASGTTTINTGRVRVGGYNNGSESANANGTLTMSGSSTLTTANGYDFWLGNGTGSTGTLNLSGSSQLTVNNTGTAGRASGTAIATQTGTSKFITAGGFAFAEDAGGNATWSVADSATLQIGGQANVGQGGNATITVQDTATFSAGTNLSVGQGGTGVLNVQGGAVSSGSEFWVGNTGPGNGTVNLSSGSITSGSWVAVGRGGAKGTLNVSGGSFTKNGTGNHWVTNGSAANVATINHTGGTITNTGSEMQLSEASGNVTAWTASAGTGNFGDFQVGRSGSATLSLSGTANYTATTVRLGVFGSGSGTLNLNGGTLAANSITKVAGGGTVKFNGTTVRARVANADFLAGFANGDLDVQAGGLKFDTNGNAVTIGQALSGVGGLTKQGAGALTLTGANGYTGVTEIAGGTLTLGSSERISNSSAVTLSGGTLNLNNFNETLAALTLGSSSTVDFGGIVGANTLAFADSSAISWNGTLTLANFDLGSDTLSFASAGLTPAQLAKIQTTIGGTLYQANGFSGNNVTFAAVPEPEQYAAGAVLMLGLAILARRKRLGTIAP